MPAGLAGLTPDALGLPVPFQLGPPEAATWVPGAAGPLQTAVSRLHQDTRRSYPAALPTAPQQGSGRSSRRGSGPHCSPGQGSTQQAQHHASGLPPVDCICLPPEEEDPVQLLPWISMVCRVCSKRDRCDSGWG